MNGVAIRAAVAESHGSAAAVAVAAPLRKWHQWREVRYLAPIQSLLLDGGLGICGPPPHTLRATQADGSIASAFSWAA